MRERILNVLIAIDQLVWVLITLGKGSPDETMSAAAWRLEKEGKLGGKIFRPIIDKIFFFDPNHCEGAHRAELRRAQLHHSYKSYK